MTEVPKTQEEAAAILGVKPTTLAMWRHKGKGPREYKIGRSCFYREIDIETWLDAQAVIPIPRTETEGVFQNLRQLQFLNAVVPHSPYWRSEISRLPQPQIPCR